MSFYRFLSGDVGIYAAVDRDCPMDDLRRQNKPDGSWLPKIGTKFPGAISFWTEHGLHSYIARGLQQWHQSVVIKPIKIIMIKQIDSVLYKDDFQIICSTDFIVNPIIVSLDQFKKLKIKTQTYDQG